MIFDKVSRHFSQFGETLILFILDPKKIQSDHFSRHVGYLIWRGRAFKKLKVIPGGGEIGNPKMISNQFSRHFSHFGVTFFFFFIFDQIFFPGWGGGINFVCIFLLVESNGASILNFSFLYAHITTSPDGRPAEWVVDCWRIRLNSARWGLTELGNYMFATDHRTFSCIEMLSQVQMKNSRMLLAVKDSLLRLFGSIYQSSHLSRRQSV